MMNDLLRYTTINHPIKATIQLPGSKSITNRALLIAALADGASLLENVLESDDTKAMNGALNALGIEHQVMDSGVYKIIGCGGRFSNQSTTINCVDAGTVLRFLLPVCAYQPGMFCFEGSSQLTRRPIEPLIQVLKQQGIKIQFSETPYSLPLTVQGTDISGTQKIHISSDVSSQFLSGLLLASPLLQSDVIITTEKMVSEPYVDMTCKIMSQFGVEVQKTDDNMFHVLPQQTYQATSYFIEPDLSTASYFFAAAALTHGELTLTQINRTTCLQGDIYFLDILEQMGCTVHSTKQSVTVIGAPYLNGIDVDIKHCSDLFMTIACLAAFAKTSSTLSGVRHTRLKESDRIAATKANLAKLGVEMLTDKEDQVTIIPSSVRPAMLESYADHRMVMAFALCGLKVPGIIMNHASCVAKTCPDFVARWESFLKY